MNNNRDINFQSTERQKRILPEDSFGDWKWREALAESMVPFIGSLLVHRNKVNPLATLVASSRNPSETTPHPSGRVHGRIEVGAVANINVLGGHQWESWCNQPGTSPFMATMLNGKLHYH